MSPRVTSTGGLLTSDLEGCRARIVLWPFYNWLRAALSVLKFDNKDTPASGKCSGLLDGLEETASRRNLGLLALLGAHQSPG